MGLELSRAVRVVRAAGRFARVPAVRQDALHEWRRRLGGEPPLPPGPIERVLVLCHGNLCRSPFAAALLIARAPQLEVRSGGLFAGEGDPAEPQARATARRFGLCLESHRSRPLRDDDLAWAQLVLGMQGRHAAEVARRWPAAAARVRLLGHYLDAPPYTLDDPWGHPDAVFLETFERLEAALTRLLARLEAARA